MSANIIEIKIKPTYVLIRPTKFVFPMDKTFGKGFIAYDNNGHQFFYYPINSDPKTQPLDFLYECIIKGPHEFKKMMKKAYLEKRSVRIGQIEIVWAEYGEIFRETDLYVKPIKPKIIDTRVG